MEYLQKALAFIVCLGVLIAVHEFGHFWVARRNGVRVLRFSIGFGKPLLRWTDRLGTEFIIAALPLGGYVKMVGEPGSTDEAIDPAESFAHKSVARRSAIVAAGPLVNLGFAFLLYYGLFVHGMTGMVPTIGEVSPGSVAAQAGVVSGGEVVAIDGHETSTWEAVNLALVDRIGETGAIRVTVRQQADALPRDYTLHVEAFMNGKEKESPLDLLGIQRVYPRVPAVLGQVVKGKAGARQGLQEEDIVVSAAGNPLSEWKDWVAIVRAHPGVPFDVVVERAGKQVPLTITPDVVTDEDGVRFGQIGVGPKPVDVPDHMIRTYSYSWSESIVRAASHTGSLISITLNTLGKMAMGKLSLDSLSGPITIARLAGESAVYGLETFISFMAYLSISLGVLNLLPIPVLDGGHLLFYLVEWIKGSPVSERAQHIGQSIGLGLLMMFMGLALYNDVVSF